MLEIGRDSDFGLWTSVVLGVGVVSNNKELSANLKKFAL